MAAITLDRWQEAQAAERKCHTMTMTEGLSHYGKAYGWNFYYCGIQENQRGKSIIEIGCADIPALYFCKNYTGWVIEPMPSEILETLCHERSIGLVKEPFEELKYDYVNIDEIWLFNVLQHVIDPDDLVNKGKKTANVIRFFEPLDCEITEYHPHSISLADLEKWFGEVKIYDDKQPGFHDGPCGYGVWKK